MQGSEVTKDIFRISVNAEPNSLLFESIWPIPEGVSMNSYVVRGEKTAIIDGVCGWDGVPETLFRLLGEIGVSFESIDYVIVNHMEPDHSEWLSKFVKMRPGIAIYTTEKAKALLKAFFNIEENIHVVKTGDTLDLGNGHVLQFGETPNVHWPETMFTFDQKEGVLFPCDAFGSFKSVPEFAYDDKLSSAELEAFDPETLRYYANIVGPFSSAVKKAIEKYNQLDIRIIAPGHGLVWRKNWKKIYYDYARYADYADGPAEEAILLVWSSMYGNTERAVKVAREELQRTGITFYEHRIPDAHISFILRDAWRSSGIIVAAPTYEYKMFPLMAPVIDELAKKKIRNRKAFHFGSYGWKSGTQEELDEINERNKSKWDYIDPVTFVCNPDQRSMDIVKQGVNSLVSSVRDWVRRK